MIFENDTETGRDGALRKWRCHRRHPYTGRNPALRHGTTSDHARCAAKRGADGAARAVPTCKKLLALFSKKRTIRRVLWFNYEIRYILRFDFSSLFLCSGHSPALFPGQSPARHRFSIQFFPRQPISCHRSAIPNERLGAVHRTAK